MATPWAASSARSFDELVEIFNPDPGGGASRYFKLNLTNLSPAHDERRGQIKTIEFRQHSATWEAEKSCAWIMLLQLFVAHFKRQHTFPSPPAEPLTPAGLLTLLLTTIGAPPILAEWWWNRSSKLDQRRGAPRLIRVNTMERAAGYQGMLQTVQNALGYISAPIRNLYTAATSVNTTPRDLEPPTTPTTQLRSREPPSTPTTVQQPRQGRQASQQPRQGRQASQQPRLTVTANSTLNELKTFIDEHVPGVSKATGGRARRTKQDIYNDIVDAFRDRSYG